MQLRSLRRYVKSSRVDVVPDHSCRRRYQGNGMQEGSTDPAGGVVDYAHVVAPIRDAVALQVGGLLWPEIEPPRNRE